MHIHNYMKLIRVTSTLNSGVRFNIIFNQKCGHGT